MGLGKTLLTAGTALTILASAGCSDSKVEEPKINITGGLVYDPKKIAISKLEEHLSSTGENYQVIAKVLNDSTYSLTHINKDSTKDTVENYTMTINPSFYESHLRYEFNLSGGIPSQVEIEVNGRDARVVKDSP